MLYTYLPRNYSKGSSRHTTSRMNPEDTMALFADAYPAAYQTLYEAKPITCSTTGTTFDALPAPCAVVLDVGVRMYYGRQ